MYNALRGKQIKRHFASFVTLETAFILFKSTRTTYAQNTQAREFYGVNRALDRNLDHLLS